MLFPQPAKTEILDFDVMQTQQYITFEEEQIERRLKQINNVAAPGRSGINGVLLKKLGPRQIKTLKQLFETLVN